MLLPVGIFMLFFALKAERTLLLYKSRSPPVNLIFEFRLIGGQNMDNKRPKRRKDKYNPYTLHTEKGKYYISFTDANNCIQKVLISKKIFDSFNKFELEDISWMNEYDRHYEHSEIYESTLHERGAINVECMEEYLDNTQNMENLHMAIKICRKCRNAD